MIIRRAKNKDIERILHILHQVLEIHAKLRPDIFIPGTTKYTKEELESKIDNDKEPIYVATDDNDFVLGYAFCKILEPAFTTTMIRFTTLYIDDLCVDEKCRGQHIGEALFEYVKTEAKKMGCYDLTLNVWTGNEGAERFYERMGMTTKERQMEIIL